jgi:hypothetical protein
MPVWYSWDKEIVMNRQIVYKNNIELLLKGISDEKPTNASIKLIAKIKQQNFASQSQVKKLQKIIKRNGWGV